MATTQTESNQIDKTQNPGSVYYLHPSDHSTMKSVTTPFNGVGFADWKRSLIIGLVSKNKMAFVDGTLTKPAASSPDFKAWERCNNMLIGWIMTSIERSLAKSVMYYTSARDIWLNLEERFGQSSATQLYHVQQDLAALTQGETTIAEYYTKAKALWDELDNIDPLTMCTFNGCSCDTTKRNLKQMQNQRLINFLMHLDERFSQARTNILVMESLPSHSQVYRLLMQEERHKEINQMAHQTTNSMAFHADKRKYHHPNSHKSSFSGKRNNYYCEHCKISGHSLERCFKVHGYP